MAATALILPARIAGPTAARAAVATAMASTAATTGRDGMNLAGSPNDCDVSARIGALPMVPATTPATDPTTTGASSWTRRIVETWAGVNPMAFMTPISR